MKKIIVVLWLGLFLLPFVFTYSQARIDTVQTGVESDCETNIENIFKVNDFKLKYEIVEYIHRESLQKRSFLFSKNSYHVLNHYFISIRGFPYFEQLKDSISSVKPGESIEVEYMSEAEVNKYIEQLNYKSEEAYRDYSDFIRSIKLEKELYLKCIDTELAKKFDSEYAKEILRYELKFSSPSLRPSWVTKLDFLKVFKEFIFNDDEVVLPNYLRTMVYLECGCRTPSFRESSLRD